VVEWQLVKFEPAAQSENDSGRIVPSGISFQDAVDSLAQVKRGKTLTSQEKGRRKKILKQLERARKKWKASFEP
jgi:hypothetical protein